jgi:four helix bundle protein
MSGLPYAKSYKELLVYQKARQLAAEVYVKSRAFPRDEMHSLTDQIRRSSRSIGAQIAEAWGKRNYIRHFISKLTDADSEQYETQHWIEVARDCGYLSPEEMKALVSQCQEIGRLLGGMMQKAELFCNPEGTLREENAAYFTSPDPAD